MRPTFRFPSGAHDKAVYQSLSSSVEAYLFLFIYLFQSQNVRVPNIGTDGVCLSLELVSLRQMFPILLPPT